VFEQPYAAPNDLDLGAVSGTTSNLTANPNIQLGAPLTNGTVFQEDYAETVQPGDTVRDWSGRVDFSGYDWNGAPDEAAVYALSGNTGSDDAEAVTVYKQTINDVTVTAEPASVQGAQTTTGVVTVTDAQGAPIAGAEVIREDGGAVAYTNSKGRAEFPGLAGSVAGIQHFFYVNTTDVDAYENNVDFRKSVTVTSYAPAATTLTASSADGAAFDFDEYAGGDVKVTVKDQNNNPLAGETVFFNWDVTPFTGAAASLPQGTAVDNGDGTYTVAFPGGQPEGTYTLNFYINGDGTPGQQAGDPTGPDLVVKAGEADLVWKDGATAQAPAGATTTFEGNLELEDGTGLTGRTVDLTWTKTGLGNAVLAAQGAQPAGTTRGGDTAATAVTAADGKFAVAISDPATPDADELNGDLDADTAFTAPSNLDVDFLKNAGPTTPDDITVNVANLIDGKATPGRPVDLDIDVENSDGVDLTDYPVTVKVDRGFLSPNAEGVADLVADPAPAQDGLYGEWKSDGTETALTTDDGGDTGAVVAIENDPGFATSDTVTTTVTVTAGNVTKTVQVAFKSIDPLNGSEVRLDLSAPADQTVRVLPKAPTTESVSYDLFVEDQFGNLVKGETVDLTDNLVGAEVNGVDGATTALSQLENESPAVILSSGAAGSQVVSADWKVDANTWIDGDAVTAGFQAERKNDNEAKTFEDDAAAVDWYAIDYAASHYAMKHTGGANLPVGATTTVTYAAVDQNGEPIQGLQVNFFRTGPDNLQDGEGNAAVITDANGLAQYTFAGAKAGTAIVAAVVREPLPSTTIIPEAGVTHSVKFGAGDVKVNPNLRITKGVSKGNKDVLTLKASPKAKGGKVVLYRQIGNGQIKKVGEGRLNSQGKLVLRVKDVNGKGKAKYAAIVRATKATKQDQSNNKTVR
jgi:hypothetical protein